MYPDYQLELALESPYTLRLPLEEALSFFWENDWQYTVKAKNTKNCFKRLREFFRLQGIRYVDEVAKSTVEAMRRWLKGEGLKESTINTHHMIVTRFYNFLFECKEKGKVGIIDFRRIPLPPRNPGALVPKVNETQFSRNAAWPKWMVYKLVHASIRMGNLSMAEIIEVLYLTRLRPGDLWEITDRNVDLARGVLHGVQHKTVTRKLPSGKPYLVKFRKRVGAILKRRMDNVPSGSPLFRNQTFTPAGWLQHIGRQFKLVREFAGLKHVQLRDFRPSSATLLLDNHVDPETVKDSLGHSSLRLLPIYTRRTTAHLDRAQEILENEDTEIIGG